MPVETLVNVQYLRAIAAISVVGTHTFWGFGAEGVDLFFIISGFIMFYIMDRSSKGALEFALDRWFRVAPIYYMFTVIFIILGAVELDSFHQIIQTLTFLKYYETSPLLSIGWTLEYEFAFYMLCAFSLFIPHRNLQKIFVLVSLLLAVFVIDFVFYADKKYGHFMEFLFGAIAYILFCRGHRLTPTLSYLLLLVGLTILIFVNFLFYSDGNYYLRFIGFGLPCLMIFYAAVCIEGKLPKMKTLHLLGDASYSIYISHTSSLFALYSVFGFTRYQYLYFDVFSFFFSIVVGLIVYYFIEKNITAYIRALRAKA